MPSPTAGTAAHPSTAAGTAAAAAAEEETRYENKTNDMIWLELQAWFAGTLNIGCTVEAFDM